MKLFLASSAFKSATFDLMATVDAATEYSFAGAQLFLNETHLSRLGDLRQVSERAHRAGLDIIVHLPSGSTPEISPSLLSLLEYQRERRAVLHFSPGEKVPEISPVALGLENSISGYDEDYYRRLFSVITSRGLFLAFDVPHLFSVPPGDFYPVRNFAEETLRKLTERDVVHLIDLKSCDGSRSNWCPVGEGVMEPFLPIIVQFEGPVVLEFEDLKQALQSRRNLLHFAA